MQWRLNTVRRYVNLTAYHLMMSLTGQVYMNNYEFINRKVSIEGLSRAIDANASEIFSF